MSSCLEIEWLVELEHNKTREFRVAHARQTPMKPSVMLPSRLSHHVNQSLGIGFTHHNLPTKAPNEPKSLPKKRRKPKHLIKKVEGSGCIWIRTARGYGVSDIEVWVNTNTHES